MFFASRFWLNAYNVGVIWLAASAAVAAAILNAGSSVLQRLATGKPDAKDLFSRHFARAVTLSRLFLLGLGLEIGGFVMQAVALGNGSLVLVEPILTCDLIFLLIFMFIKAKIKTTWRDWLAVAAVVIGLGVSLVVAAPRGGHLRYQLLPWIITVVIVGSYTIVIGVVSRRMSSPSFRGFLVALTAASAFAMNAAFTKLAFNVLQSRGLAAVLISWPIYALIVSGITSLYLMQNSYGSGPLAITQPTIEIAEPMISVVIGMLIFGDTINHTLGALVVEVAGIVLLGVGIIALASSQNIQRAGENGL